MPKWDNKITEDLFKVILKLGNLKEAKRFFRDLLTEAEIIEFAKRWRAAQMLNENIPYSRIEKETGLSSRTISRVAKWLKQGMGGYKLMLEKHHSSFPFGKGLH